MLCCFAGDLVGAKIHHCITEHCIIILNRSGLFYVEKFVPESHDSINVTELIPKLIKDILERFVLEYTCETPICGAV